MSQYNIHVITSLEQLQSVVIRKLRRNYDSYQLNIAKKRFEIINRNRRRNILDDIISFEEYITREFFEVINDMSNYNIIHNFKRLLKRIEQNASPDPQFILMNIYDKYFCKCNEIKEIFISKSKEFNWCIEHNLLSENEILCWNQSLLRLEKLIKESFIKYDEYDDHLTLKFYNMCLINKITRKYFSIDDDSKTTFENNYIVRQLKNEMEAGNIIELIKSFINPFTQSFEGWINRLLVYD